MIRFRHNSLLLVLVFLSNFLLGQNPNHDRQVKVALNFVDYYNNQDYSRMKKSFFTVARLFALKKGLRQTFEPRFTKFGKAKIDTILFPTDKKLIVKLTYQADKSEKDNLVLHLTKRNKIAGVSFDGPNFLYPKWINNLSEQTKALKIDSLLKQKYANEFNGNILVIDNGNVLYKKSFGFADFNNKYLLDDNSVFELASCSKQFTAMAIMMLVEQGKINYTDNIQKYIPDLPYQNITVENLLTHTSGLPDYMELLQKHWDKKQFATNYDIVSLFKKYKPKVHFTPNETFEYSNTGYALLSIIIEKVSGTSYAEYLERNIFTPLGMKNSRVYNTRRVKKERINNYAYGYVYSDKLKRYILPDSLSDYDMVIYMDAITGDGTINTTTTDLVYWDKALRENKLVQNKTIQKAFSKHKLLNGKTSNYGYGLCIGDNDKYEKVVYHGGNWPGYSTFILHFIDKNTTIIILSNNAYENIEKLADQITQLL